MTNKLEELQAGHELISKKIRLMREMLVIETRVEEQLRYEILIKQDEERRKKIELELEDEERRKKNNLDLESSVNQSQILVSSSPLYDYKKIILNPIGFPLDIQCVFSNTVNLGRSSECDFSFVQASLKVSNWQARVHYQPRTNEYYIQDLESTNGTYVNGQRIERSTPLSLGSKIELGRALSFLFEHDLDNDLSTGTLVYLSAEGKELARYVIAPKACVAIGSTVEEAIRLPFTQVSYPLGFITRKVDGFYYSPQRTEISGDHLRLEDNSTFEIASWNIRVRIPK